MFATSLLLSWRLSREFPDRRPRSGVRTDRPGAASLAVAYVAAFVGVFATPLPSGSEAAVGFLAVLVGLTAYYGGVLSERERLRAGGGSEAPARAVSEND